jgi:pyruvate dehydrogenase E2 component (dihydrolipoamide acetyltransferase)
MATDVILPALGMSQDTGKIVQWFKAEGEQVTAGEPLLEIETDKATVEIEAPASGVLADLSSSAGDDVPVGQVIAHILAAGEVSVDAGKSVTPTASMNNGHKPEAVEASPSTTAPQVGSAASALASRIAAEHQLDLSQVKPAGRRIQKADVLQYLQSQQTAAASSEAGKRVLASPKARRLAAEQQQALATIVGSGPEGAVLAADVLAAVAQATQAVTEAVVQHLPTEQPAEQSNGSATSEELSLGNTWRIMAERTTQSWTSVPHFYLVREVNVSRLMAWREQANKRSSVKLTYTDLLVKIVATALRAHPRVNVSWQAGKLALQPEIHVGLAAAVENGLVVPVIHRADTLGLAEIAQQRLELIEKAQRGKLSLQNISGGTFTISNLGMYNVDAFNAIINQPQAAILAVGRIAERVVPVNHQPAVQPMLLLTLSCDHRAIDGARGAQFLDTLANLIEEPLGLIS